MRKLLGLGVFLALAWLLNWQGTPGPRTALARAAQGEDKKKKEEKKAGEDEKEAKGPFKNLKYRLVGPAAGGRVSRACGVPGDPSTYYLAAATGGVWKSSDGGLTWKSVFDDEPTASMGAI